MLNLTEVQDDLEAREPSEMRENLSLDALGQVKLTCIKLNEIQRVSDPLSVTAALSRINTAIVENDVKQANTLTDIIFEH